MKDRKMPSWQLPIAGFKSKFDNRQSVGFGEVSEWLIEPVSKTGVPFGYRGFESRPLRSFST
jgi:hypothetical protein